MQIQKWLALFIPTLLALPSCGGNDKSATDRQTPATTLQPVENDPSSATSGDTASDTPPDEATISLFKDSPDFTAAQLNAGASNCSVVADKEARLSSLIIPWPEDLKVFLSSELKKNFPLYANMGDFLHGFYLVKDEVFAEASSGASGTFAGLTCDRGEDNKGLIFLSEDAFVTQRQQSGLGKWQKMQGVQYDFMLLEVPDQAFFTLVHELFHAVDTKLFFKTTDQSALDKREASIRLAWTTFDAPKWSRITMTTLRDEDVLKAYWDSRKKYPLICRSKRQPLALADHVYTAGEIKTELSHLKNDTNFLVPYSMVNAAEDFAESMAAYVIGTRANEWDLRVVYDQAITTTLDGHTESYRHDSGDMAKNSPKHKEKLCFFAEMALGEDCQIK